MKNLTHHFKLLIVILIVWLVLAGWAHSAGQSLSGIEQRMNELEQQIEQEQEKLKQLENSFGLFAGTATAYTPFDDRSGLSSDGYPEETATGTYPTVGTIAVNPETIPYGAEVTVIGEGWIYEGTAEDTGGAMRQNPRQVDLYMDCYDDAMEFGKQEVIIFWRDINENKQKENSGVEGSS